MKKIDLETHFITKEYMKFMNRHKGYPRYGEDPQTKKRRLFYAPEVGEPLGDPLIEKLLDRYPKLKILLGHYGEGLPFLTHRINFAYDKPWFDPEATPKLKRKPSDYLRDNVYYTTSGNYFKGAWQCTYEAVGPEHMLLATDYPYDDPEECMAFLGSLSLSDEIKKKLYHENARELGIAA